MTMQSSNADFYNERYKQADYFHYPNWIYAPYVASLIKYCNLQKGASILDIGCGQGYFSYLFCRQGMRVHGVDISETGISLAEKSYGAFGVKFSVADMQAATFGEEFDCLFVRSCSLYNTDSFSSEKTVTLNFLKHLKKGGVLIFIYNSSVSSKKSSSWRYHTLEDVAIHFDSWPGAKTYFVNKILMPGLRQFSFTSLATQLNLAVCKFTGAGGDLVCFLRKP